MRVAVLVDYRRCFWSSTSNVRTGTSMDVALIERLLRDARHEPVVIEYSQVNLRDDWNGVPFIYTSSEDAGLKYKGFIEDTVQALEMNGARAIPGHPLLRAHHNKVFMEFLRKTWLLNDPMGDATWEFGAIEELISRTGEARLPAVVKSAAGAGSQGVRLAADTSQLLKQAKELSKSDNLGVEMKERLRSALRPGYLKASTHRCPFIVQRQIPGLMGDFKVLKYGKRYFAVFRENRQEDPFASGSGRLNFNVEEHVDISSLLAFAGYVADSIPSPWLSIDIASSTRGFELIEFQAVHFGPATLEKGNHHYLRGVDGNFDRVEGNPRLEEAFVDSLLEVL